MKKRLFAVLLCIIMAMTLLPVTAQATDSSPVYTFTSDQIVDYDEMGYIYDQVFLKGDTIVFIPDDNEPFIPNQTGACHTPNVGVRFCDMNGTDVTGGICRVNEYSTDGSGCMTSFTITSDNPVRIRYTGAGPTGIQNPAQPREHGENYYAYRYLQLTFDSYPTNYVIDYDLGSYGSWSGVANHPTSLVIAGNKRNYTLHIPTPNSTDSNYYFDGWSVSENASIIGLEDLKASEYPQIAYPVNDATDIALNFGFKFTGKREGAEGFTLKANWSNKQRVAAPTFSIDGGNYSSAQNVTLSCNTPDARIFYTTDGSFPTDRSIPYTEPIEVSVTATITAVAYRPAWLVMATSEVLAETYTIGTAAVGTVAKPTFTPDAGTYGIEQKVTLTCDTAGAIIRYTTDGSVPTANSPVYGSAISVSSTSTIKAKAFKDGMTASAVASATYTISAQTVKESGVSVLPSANGSVTADRTAAKQGETVTFTVAPADGYKLKQIQILDGLGQDLCVEIGLKVTNNSFQMPDMKVKIQAIFEKINSDGKEQEFVEQDGTVHFSKPIPDDCILDIREMQQIPSFYSLKDGEVVMLFDIAVLRNNSLYSVSDNSITVTIVLPEKLVGYDYYRVSYVNNDNELTETQTATVNGNKLQFMTSHLSVYMIEAGNNQDHTHSYDSEWKSDDANHWHECSCGDKSDTETHSFGDWLIVNNATSTENGSKERTCSVCGYKETAAVSSASEIDSGTQSGGDSNNLIWIVPLIVGCAAVIGTGVYFIIRKRRTAK